MERVTLQVKMLKLLDQISSSLQIKISSVAENAKTLGIRVDSLEGKITIANNSITNLKSSTSTVPIINYVNREIEL